MKKKLFYAVAMLFCLVSLTSCPYSTSVPLTEANTKANSDYYGKWCEEDDLAYGTNPTYYEVKESDHKDGDNEYLFEEYSWSYSDEKYDKTKYYAHISTIKGVDFLNVHSADDEETFYFYRIEKDGDNFKVVEVTENITESFTSSSALKKFFEEHMHLSFFYENYEETYVRQ